MSMKPIFKQRREWFGGVVYSEHPGYTAFVDSRRADSLGIPPSDDLPHGLYSAPLDVHIGLTTRCNLRCDGCYSHDKTQPQVDMPFDRATAIIDHLAAMNVFTVSFGGGEPLLHPRVFDIARHARSRNIAPNITTNGLMIDSSTAEQCQIFGSLHLSCHDANELDRLSQSVRHLKNCGIEPGLNVLVSVATHSQLPKICCWASGHKISRVLFLKFKLTDTNRQHSSMVLDSAQEQSLLSTIRKLSRKHGFMPLLDCSFFPILALHSARKSDLKYFDVNGCLGGNAILAVTTDGQYKPCSFWPETFGEIESLDSDTWINDERLNGFRNGRQLEGCPQCDYEDLCNGGCRVCDRQGCRA